MAISIFFIDASSLGLSLSLGFVWLPWTSAFRDGAKIVARRWGRKSQRDGPSRDRLANEGRAEAQARHRGRVSGGTGQGRRQMHQRGPSSGASRLVGLRRANLKFFATPSSSIRCLSHPSGNTNRTLSVLCPRTYHALQFTNFDLPSSNPRSPVSWQNGHSVCARKGSFSICSVPIFVTGPTTLSTLNEVPFGRCSNVHCPLNPGPAIQDASLRDTNSGADCRFHHTRHAKIRRSSESSTRWPAGRCPRTTTAGSPRSYL